MITKQEYLKGLAKAKQYADDVTPTNLSELQNDVGFITESDIPEIPTKTSDLTNDSGFITEEDVPTKTSDLTNDSGFITQSDVPTKTSDLTNDSGFITESDIPEIPTKTSDLTNDSGFITESDVPTKTSDLTNDSGFITISSVPTKTSDLTNDSGFITQSDIPEIPTKTSDLTNDSGFITISSVPTKTSDLTNDSGFITEAPVTDVTVNGTSVVDENGVAVIANTGGSVKEDLVDNPITLTDPEKDTAKTTLGVYKKNVVQTDEWDTTQESVGRLSTSNGEPDASYFAFTTSPFVPIAKGEDYVARVEGVPSHEQLPLVACYYNSQKVFIGLYYNQRKDYWNPNTSFTLTAPDSDNSIAYVRVSLPSERYWSGSTRHLLKTNTALLKPVYGVTVNGTSVVNEDGVAVITNTGGVTDVKVNGTSVVNGDGVANLPVIPTKTSDLTNDSGFVTSIPVKDVTVNGTSVVNGSGVAVITNTGGGGVKEELVDNPISLTSSEKDTAQTTLGVIKYKLVDYWEVAGNGYFSSSGTVVANDYYRYGTRIPVTNGEQITVSVEGVGGSKWVGIFWYNTNGTYRSCDDSQYAFPMSKTVTAPSDGYLAVYFSYVSGSTYHVYKNGLAKPLYDVTLNGSSVVSNDVANINAVTGVLVDGVSVVTDGVANITTGGGGGGGGDDSGMQVVNLLDFDRCVYGWSLYQGSFYRYNTNATESDGSSYSYTVTDLMNLQSYGKDISEGNAYINFVYEFLDGFNFNPVSAEFNFYSSTKSFISSASVGMSSVTMYSNDRRYYSSRAIPTNAYYVRISFRQRYMMNSSNTKYKDIKVMAFVNTSGLTSSTVPVHVPYYRPVNDVMMASSQNLLCPSVYQASKVIYIGGGYGDGGTSYDAFVIPLNGYSKENAMFEGFTFQLWNTRTRPTRSYYSPEVRARFYSSSTPTSSTAYPTFGITGDQYISPAIDNWNYCRLTITPEMIPSSLDSNAVLVISAPKASTEWNAPNADVKYMLNYGMVALPWSPYGTN